MLATTTRAQLYAELRAMLWTASAGDAAQIQGAIDWLKDTDDGLDTDDGALAVECARRIVKGFRK